VVSANSPREGVRSRGPQTTRASALNAARSFAESLVEQNAWHVQQSEAPLVRRWPGLRAISAPSISTSSHAPWTFLPWCSIAALAFDPPDSSPSSMMGMNVIMYSGTVACSSRGVDRGLVMSAMIKRHRPASVLTVSVKSLFPASQN
jgi:hypothetical protein